MKPPNILSDYLAIFSQHVAMLRRRCSLVESTIHYSLNGRLIAATIFTTILRVQWAVISGGSMRRIVFCNLNPSEYLCHCVRLLHFTEKEVWFAVRDPSRKISHSMYSSHTTLRLDIKLEKH